MTPEDSVGCRVWIVLLVKCFDFCLDMFLWLVPPLSLERWFRKNPAQRDWLIRKLKMPSNDGQAPQGEGCSKASAWVRENYARTPGPAACSCLLCSVSVLQLPCWSHFSDTEAMQWGGKERCRFGIWLGNQLQLHRLFARVLVEVTGTSNP